MKLKPDSWNDANGATGERGVRRSLTRAGLQLGALTHVVSDALSTLQGGSNARVSAQNRMKALLNQDRALLSHRPFAQAALLDEADEPEAAPAIPRKGSARTAAQNRMRELLNQDRAMLAFRQREGLEDDDDLDELLEYALRGQPNETSAQAAAGRSTCVGVTTSFVADASVASVCTPGPLPEAEAHVHAASSAFASPVAAAPAAAAAQAGLSAPVVVTPVLTGPIVITHAAPAPVASTAASVAAAPAVADVPAAPVAKVSEAPGSAKAEEPAADPIRTRGMAKLLALQGYRERALSIYDELIAAEPNNAELRAEADKLRSN